MRKKLEEILIKAGVVTKRQIAKAPAIQRPGSTRKITSEATEEDIQSIEGPQKDENGIDEHYTQRQAPTIIKLVATLISEAVKTKASDIHLEPQLKHINVRFRIDGDLRTIFKYKRNIHDSVVARIKRIANLDIADRRLPQDGGTRVSFQGDEINLRISTRPAIYGEQVVIRVLNHNKIKAGVTTVEEVLGKTPMEQIRRN